MTDLVDYGAPDRKSSRRRVGEFSGKRAVRAAAESTQVLKRAIVNMLWAHAPIVERCYSRQKCVTMGAGW
jgi:hypothetical protein